MNDFKPSNNTMEEVEKLQELVRKLEIQNLQLRNKQNLQGKQSESPVKEVKPSSKNVRPVRKNSQIETIVDDSENSAVGKDEYFDDLEIIKVSDIELSDDESWLYTSPKSGNPQKKESPYIRNGDNEQQQFSKNALLTKLNELEILSTSNRAVPQAGNPTSTNLGPSQLNYTKPTSGCYVESCPHYTITFTRSRKETMDYLEKLKKKLNDRNALEERRRTIEEFYVRNKGIDTSSESWSSCLVIEDPNDVEEVASKRKRFREMEGFYLRQRLSEASSDSLSNCHVHEDANDVQEVARMQEEISTPGRTVPQAGNPTSTNLGPFQFSYMKLVPGQFHGQPCALHNLTFTRSKKETMNYLEKLKLHERNASGERGRSIEEFYVRNKGIDTSSESWSSCLVIEDPNDVEEVASKRKRFREMEEFYLRRRGSDVSSDSLSSCHVLEDANDVQEVARMQEESLRMNSPLGTPKRNSGNGLLRKVSTSSKGSISDQDTSESSVFGLQVENVSSTNDSMESTHDFEACHYSDQSSPSESPYGSNASLHNVGKEKVKLGGYRRSLPNLNKDPSSARQTKVHSEKTSFSTSTYSKGKTVGKRPNIIGMFVPKAKRGAKSPSASKQSNLSLPQPVFLSPESDISEVTKSSESNDSKQRVGSGLPKPSRASSATRSIPRSGIPMPSMLGKKRNEDSWSEGCF